MPILDQISDDIDAILESEIASTVTVTPADGSAAYPVQGILRSPGLLATPGDVDLAAHGWRLLVKAPATICRGDALSIDGVAYLANIPVALAQGWALVPLREG